jgi:hypothetical protein
MSTLETEKLNDVVDKKLITDDAQIGKSFKSILSDFDVMPFLIGTVIALSFNRLLNRIVQFILNKVFKTRNELAQAAVEFILAILLINLFVHQIYYKYLVDDNISKEKIVKTAINEAKVEEAKKEIDNDPEIKRNIEQDIEFETFDQYRLFTRTKN